MSQENENAGIGALDWLDTLGIISGSLIIDSIPKMREVTPLHDTAGISL